MTKRKSKKNTKILENSFLKDEMQKWRGVEAEQENHFIRSEGNRPQGMTFSRKTVKKSKKFVSLKTSSKTPENALFITTCQFYYNKDGF